MPSLHQRFFRLIITYTVVLAPPEWPSFHSNAYLCVQQHLHLLLKDFDVIDKFCIRHCSEVIPALARISDVILAQLTEGRNLFFQIRRMLADKRRHGKPCNHMLFRRGRQFWLHMTIKRYLATQPRPATSTATRIQFFRQRDRKQDNARNITPKHT